MPKKFVPEDKMVLEEPVIRRKEPEVEPEAIVEVEPEVEVELEAEPETIVENELEPEEEILELPTTVGKVMSSVELVKIINDLRDEGAAVLRHSDFLVKIKKVLRENLAAEFLATRIDNRGKEQPCYFLPKREAHLMVMSENHKVQAAVYDRMAELESIFNKQQEQPASSDMLKIKNDFAIGIEMANMIGLDGNRAILKANNLVREVTSVDVLKKMDVRLIAEVQDNRLTPTKIRLNLGKCSS